MGRPSDYTDALADLICERIADGESLRGICKADDMPHAGTVCRWLVRHDAFREQYARAREIQADVLFDEILDIADTPFEGVKTKTVEDDDGTRVETQTGDMIEHRRLQVDARKWMLGRMQPKKYGDKLALTGADGGAIEHVVFETVYESEPKG